MSAKYRVALIGCGQRARSHVPGLLADPRCQIVALSDVMPETSAKMKQDFKLDAGTYTDHVAMLEKEKPEVVVSCLWTPLHLPVFQDCVNAGVKAVMSEKPMAPTYGLCLEMAELAQRSGVLLNFCHQRRFARGNQLARRLIADGTFGKIERMDLYSHPNLLDCGTHTFDQAFSFNNESPVRWVLGACDATEPLNWFNVPAESMFVGHMVYENGVHATMQCGGPDRELPAGVRVTGSEGFIEVQWDGEFGKAVRYSDPAWKAPAVQDNPDDHVGRMIHNVLDCLATGLEPELSYRKALRAEEVIFAFYESVRRHARITLPLKNVSDNPFITMLEAGDFARGHSAAAMANRDVPAPVA